MIVAALPVNIVPQVELRGARIYEVKSKLWPEKTYHFVGYNATEGHGRVSSAIQEFDLEKRIGVTSSGRTYVITDGRCGFRDMGDASYTWEVWKSHNQIVEEVDVTDQFIKPFEDDEAEEE